MRHKHQLWWIIATWFGSGTVKYASGTAGSLAALPFAYIIQSNYGNFALLGAAILLFFVGWWASNQFILNHPNQGMDPKQIVVDEVVGQWVLLAVLYPTWQSYLVGFLVFRLFDIVKPWPIFWADRTLKGGFGVMFDDFLAAMFPVVVYLAVMLETYMLKAPYLLVPLVNFLGGQHAY